MCGVWGTVSKRVMVKRAVLDHRSDVLFFQETKCVEIEERLVRSIWGAWSMGWIAKASVGASRGIWTIWNSAYLRLVTVEI